MSGHSEYYIRKERERQRKLQESLQEKNLLSKRISEVMTSLEALSESNKSTTDEQVNLLNKNINSTQEIITEMSEREESERIKFKASRLDLLEQLECDLNSIGKADLSDFKKKINGSDDKIEIMKTFSEAKVKAIQLIDEAAKKQREKAKVFDELGINSEDDIDENYALIDIYQQLTDLGYNPVYDPQTKKIMIQKENGNQIIANENQEGKMILDYLSFEGKSCSKDMVKIEKSLRNNKSIEDDDRVYTKWYTKEEQVQYENSQVQTTNKGIYEQIKMSKLNINQKHQ